MDDWIRASALLDSGSSGNWIHPRLIEKGHFTYRPTDDNTEFSEDFSGSPVKSAGKVKLRWQGIEVHKDRLTIFEIAPEGSPIDVLFGKSFMDTEKVFVPNPEPHIFSHRVVKKIEVCYLSATFLKYLTFSQSLADIS